MGFVDRGGGREAKNASLRRSKKNPGAAAARAKKEKEARSLQVLQPPAPFMLSLVSSINESGEVSCFFDASVSLLSRSFDVDFDGVIKRAAVGDDFVLNMLSERISNFISDSRCGGVLAWTSHIARQKELVEMSNDPSVLITVLNALENKLQEQGQTAVVKALGDQKFREHLCTKSAFIYTAIGVHPDNISRLSAADAEAYNQDIAQLVTRRNCVAVLTGLALERREKSTHNSQEIMLKSMISLAAEHSRSVLVQLGGRRSAGIGAPPALAAEVIALANNGCENDADGPSSVRTFLHLLDTITEEFSANGRSLPCIVVHNAIPVCKYDPELVARLCKEHNCYVTVSALDMQLFMDTVRVSSSEETTAAQEAQEQLAKRFSLCLAEIPSSKFLLSSDSPWGTPSCALHDADLKSRPNEPCNLPAVAAGIILAAEKGGCCTVEHVKECLSRVTDNSCSAFKIPTGIAEATPAPPAAVSPAARLTDTPEELSAGSGGTDCRKGHRNDGANEECPANSTTKVTTSVDSSPTSPDDAFPSGALFLCSKCRTPLFASGTQDPDLSDAGQWVLRFPGEYPELQIMHKEGTIVPVKCKSCGAKVGCVGENLAFTVNGGKGANQKGAKRTSYTLHAPPDRSKNYLYIVKRAVESVAEAAMERDISLEELQRKAREELARMEERREENASDDEDDGDDRKGRRRRKKNVKKNNRSNFTHFRNKDFAPGTKKSKTQGDNSDDSSSDTP